VKQIMREVTSFFITMYFMDNVINSLCIAGFHKLATMPLQ